MCGISGYYVFRNDGVPPVIGLRTLKNAIQYRGLDAHGEWHEHGVGFYHSRLSVIDLEAGAQPMVDAGRRYVIVFNGEIYNYLELRKKYRKLGVRINTNSDTEVLLAGYRLKGERVLEDLNGMFAFAIYDRETKNVFLARDRLGKKPLYWCCIRGVFYFSSTLDSFCDLQGWREVLDTDALARFCASGFWYPGDTPYTQAETVPPAHWLRVSIDSGVSRPSRYWALSFPETKSRNSLACLVEEYEELLTDALRIRLRSDVPLALTFSGGVDSGTLAALSVKRLNMEPQCYTIDYHTEDDPSEETLVAKEVARRLGLAWKHINFDYHKDLLGELEESYQYYDLPCTQMALVYSKRLYSAIKPYATVVIAGNGADELFTGYKGDERFARAGELLNYLAPLRPLLKPLPLPEVLRLTIPQAYAHSALSRTALPLEWAEAVQQGAMEIANTASDCGALSALDFKMFLSIGYSGVDSNFRLPDISGLASQVEVRSPFLDYRMVEFAARIPHWCKVRSPWMRPRTKFLPKMKYASLVGEDIAWGRKRGMAWNVNFGVSAARDPIYRDAFMRSYDTLDECGLPSAYFRDAWRAHTAHIVKKGPPSPYGSPTMTGFLLGRWLEKRKQQRRCAG